MALKKVAGSKIYIGGRVTYKDTVTLSDFAGQVWTEIGGWTEVGEMGVEQEIVSQLLINSGITQYAKGAISFPQMTNTFVPDGGDAGQTAFKAAIKSCKPFAFKIEWGADCAEVSTVTISNGSDAEVTWPAHGLANGTPVVFTTTGALPTGLTAGTTYYVVDADTDKFSVATTPGGLAIDTSSAGSGTHTATAQPVGDTDMFYGLALHGTKSGGDANATRTRTFNIQPINEGVEV